MPDCSEIILSEDYADFIGRYNASREELINQYEEQCPQFVNDKYLSLYEKIENIAPISVENYLYNSIPKLYGLMDTTAVAATGSIRLQNQTGFELTGRDVIVGFIDTGIDYTNDLFKTATGQTRILGIWDQTDNNGNHPEGLYYGSEYTREDINRAINSDRPESIVPQRDENGHGTFLAGVACGRYDEQNDFIGAAPDSFIAMVKLKPAKQYLRNYFFVNGDVPVFQENDIMLGVTYLRKLQLEYEKPLVIVLGLGCGNGGRVGLSPLSQVLDDIGNIIGNCVVVCSGNEGSARLHYSGAVSDGQVDNVELRVGENNPGFVLELWGNVPEIFSVSFISPFGESIARIPARKNKNETVNFLIEGTTIEIGYSIVESASGNELIFLRFINPSPGIWTIRVYGSNILTGRFDIWGNLRQFTDEDTYFLKPDPEKTITSPAGARNVITVGGYDNATNAFYPNSGRGFTRDNRVKPDLVAPSVNVYGPGLRQNFTRKTGTSVGTALTAGCCAQVLQWGVVETNEPYMKTDYIKSYLIRGAKRERDITYPSPQWGYGEINVFESFSVLTRV